MLTRRQLLAMAPAAALAAPKLTARQRIDRVLAGNDPDRQPFTFWYHFGLEKQPPDRHARATLAFHRKFRTDLVKVMSDFPFPKPEGDWYDVRDTDDPFPAQLKALELIRDGLGGKAHFVETIFNPWNIAEKLSSKEAVIARLRERPKSLVDCLEAIAKSEAAHARAAIERGASGIFLAIANAQDGILTEEEYNRYSEPFDRMVLDAAPSAPLNILHLHGDKVYWKRFTKGWPASAISYSAHGTGASIGEMRKHFSGLLLAGLDERNYRTLSAGDLEAQWKSARAAAGSRFLLAPGCSVPNESKDEELLRLTRLLKA